jgi:hypothetical protein
MKPTYQHFQVDLTIPFFALANQYESDGTGEGGWFRCLLIDLVSEPRGKVLIQGLSELALKWLTTSEAIKILKNLKADYLTFTIAYPESETSGNWHDDEFNALFKAWSPYYGRCPMPNSPFEACVNVKTITIQLGNWYIYFQGYDQRPYAEQTTMINLPSFDNYEVQKKAEEHWVQWRGAKYGIVYD